MTITPAQIDEWRAARSEHQNLEFKEAKDGLDSRKLCRYCVGLANEGGGHLLLGIEDKPPRKVVGTAAVNDPVGMAAKLFSTLKFRVEVEEVQHPGGRVIVFQIPSRPLGTAYQYEGAYLMRSGEELVPMSEDRLRTIFAEGQPDWLSQSAMSAAADDDVIAMLDTQGYFDLLKLPYPTQRTGVLERLTGDGLIREDGNGWEISNLAAVLFAKKLDAFSPALARKAVRVVIYDGINKLKTKDDKPGNRGYAIGFESLVDFVHSAAPQNRFIEQAVREEVKMFPKQALRELIANALVHQDFLMTGTSVMIEMYDDRVEISNPGLPPIKVERFIDEYRSRNERLADLMRRMGICEEKGSGIDKVITAAEFFQLPAPDFRAGELRTTAILFAHQEFPEMSRSDRIRACYQHCCLQYVSGKTMSNQSLRTRFGVDENKVATVSTVIMAAKDAGLIKQDASESMSTRYARYLPFWA
ncbi:MAG: ATP-binding protein [Planctomycetaceae bacterium]